MCRFHADVQQRLHAASNLKYIARHLVNFDSSVVDQATVCLLSHSHTLAVNVDFTCIQPQMAKPTLEVLAKLPFRQMIERYTHLVVL